jgi:aspartate/methionine/tyrosine aminotransferase
MKPIFVPTPSTTDPFSLAITTSYETAFQQAVESGIRPRALMLCNPHNPLGRCYPPSTLIAFMRFCDKHGIHMLADEIYAMSVYSIAEEGKGDETETTTPFTSVLSLPTSEYIGK